VVRKGGLYGVFFELAATLTSLGIDVGGHGGAGRGSFAATWLGSLLGSGVGVVPLAVGLWSMGEEMVSFSL